MIGRLDDLYFICAIKLDLLAKSDSRSSIQRGHTDEDTFYDRNTNPEHLDCVPIVIDFYGEIVGAALYLYYMYISMLTRRLLDKASCSSLAMKSVKSRSKEIEFCM